VPSQKVEVTIGSAAAAAAVDVDDMATRLFAALLLVVDDGQLVMGFLRRVSRGR